MMGSSSFPTLAIVGWSVGCLQVGSLRPDDLNPAEMTAATIPWPQGFGWVCEEVDPAFVICRQPISHNPAEITTFSPLDPTSGEQANLHCICCPWILPATPPMSFFPEALLPHSTGRLLPVWGPSEPLAVLHPVGQLIGAGGPVVVVLLGMSILALTVAVAKVWQFASLELNQLRTVRHVLALHLEGESTEALAVARRCRNPAAAVLAQAIRGQFHQMPTAVVREEVERASHALVISLRANLRLLEVTASLAPLLGLLGTVLGMIKAFQQIAQAENSINPSTLSGGIWEALLTTAVGLSVAIPVVAVHNWLEGRVEHFTHGLADVTTRVFTTDLSQDQQVTP